MSIDPKIMDWIVERMKIESLNEKLSENIHLWISGSKQPTFNQIEDLSRAINIPLGYFFLKTPPTEDLSLLEYRTTNSRELNNPSRNLIDTIRQMENVQDWMRNYMIESNDSILEFVGSQKRSKDVLDIASKMREVLGLKINWYLDSQDANDSFKRVRKHAEEIGIVVMMNGIVGNNTHRKLDIEEFRAFTLIDDYAPLIFINSNDSANGKLFSLFHEMSHIWMGRNSLFNDRFSNETNISEIEVICNAITGELLVPNVNFIEEWKLCNNNFTIEEKVRALSNLFNCGITVIARKALNNNYINASQYSMIAEKAISNFLALQERKQNESSSGGDFYRTIATRLDGRFLNALANSTQEGKTLYTDAFALTNTNRTTFITLIRKMRGES